MEPAKIFAIKKLSCKTDPMDKDESEVIEHLRFVIRELQKEVKCLEREVTELRDHKEKLQLLLESQAKVL